MRDQVISLGIQDKVIGFLNHSHLTRYSTSTLDYILATSISLFDLEMLCPHNLEALLVLRLMLKLYLSNLSN